MSVGARPSDLPLPRPTPAADRRIREGLVRLGLGACGAFSFATTLAIVVVLFQETRQFFALDDVTLLDFLLGSQWNPLLGGEKSFGIWPLVTGTLLVTCIAMTVAVPLGLLTAIYLSEYAAPAFRTVARPALEILAGIPTVVFGFFALREITPLLQSVFPSFEIYNAFSAGVAVGLLCVPIVSSLTEDALRAVPAHLRAAAFALGATRFEVATRVVVPAAGSGLVAAVLLAAARAIGETMIVALAAGTIASVSIDPRGPVQTMTGFMVQIFMGDVSNFGAEYLSCYAVAAALFVMTLALTLVGQVVRRRFQETYR